MHSCPLALTTILALLWEGRAPRAQEQAPPVPALDVELTAEHFALWRDHIRPAADELRWESIPWLPTFSAGLSAADAQGKPLLLWLMNGHPLGCT